MTTDTDRGKIVTAQKSVPKFEAMAANYGAQERINQPDKKESSIAPMHQKGRSESRHTERMKIQG